MFHVLLNAEYMYLVHFTLLILSNYMDGVVPFRDFSELNPHDIKGNNRKVCLGAFRNHLPNCAHKDSVLANPSVGT